ncbi:MAG: hypothetical protein JW925_10125 [Syntrophaceae bacterium]|nr:hypothetical protein [Syntrophaceae bacterium]
MRLKHTWRTPLLSVIKRSNPEENVLTACKGTSFSGFMGGSNGKKQGCYLQAAAANCTGECSDITST